MKLIWSVTENLGDWSDVRKRLHDQMSLLRGTPAAGLTLEDFALSGRDRPPTPNCTSPASSAGSCATPKAVGWSPETPGRISGRAKANTSGASPDRSDSLPFARHAAPNDAGTEPASTETLASRAAGLGTWGVLRGDVDNFGIRIRRAQTIEEHIQLSVMYKQFFAGELEVLCSMPEFWRKVTVIYSGGDDFAVYGAWDALIGLAREMERLFRRFTEANLTDFAGPEGKTITMALALAPAEDASLGSVFEEAGRRLEAAKSADKDCIWLLGRTLEWKQFTDAADLKDLLLRMVDGFRSLRAILEGPVRNLPRDAIENVQAPGAQNGRRAAVALSSTHPPHPERRAAVFRTRARRLPEGAHRADRGSDRHGAPSP